MCAKVTLGEKFVRAKVTAQGRPTIQKAKKPKRGDRAHDRDGQEELFC
jgi:hypothetical protein